MKLPLDTKVHRAFKCAVGIQPAVPPWDCAAGMHEPVWVRFCGEFRCAGCFKRLGARS